MAGPVIQLRATKYDKSDEAKMLKMLERIAVIYEKKSNNYEFCFKKGKTLGLNLKANSCVFLLNISEFDEEDDLRKADIAEKLKDKPAAFFNVAAMCNGKDDHRLLAAFVLELHKIGRGYICLNGVISVPYLTDKNGYILKNERGDFLHQNKADFFNSIRGELHEIRYNIDETRTYYSHVCDAEWLDNWLQHVDFHLIK
jgi:Family of unknown function (DUF6368)